MMELLKVVTKGVIGRKTNQNLIKATMYSETEHSNFVSSYTNFVSLIFNNRQR